MEYNRTHKWYDVLDSITLGYNKTYHRIIGMAPIDVTKEMEGKIWKRVYLPKLKQNKPLKRKLKIRKPYKIFNIKIGDHVRISYIKEPFKRFYDENWSREIYIVESREFKRGKAEYKLKDYNNDSIIGVFYDNELQKIIEDKNKTYMIEKVVKTKGAGRNKQYFVKWFGWHRKFNSWIPAVELKQTVYT